MAPGIGAAARGSLPARRTLGGAGHAAQLDASRQPLDMPGVFRFVRYLVTLRAGQRAADAAFQVSPMCADADRRDGDVPGGVARWRRIVAHAVAGGAAPVAVGLDTSVH